MTKSLNSVFDFLRLPSAISDFEYGYLKRVNRVAYAFFLVHLAVLPAVAWASGTGPVSALLMTAFVLGGTTAGYALLKNPRHKSLVFGATAMLIGALLVHFGQGPVQIEMHFYFFALLAMLCMFANPTVNLAAAGTVAVHHALGWWLLPASLFNYDAAWWVVAVHAGFVVLETAGCCFIARTFYDSVMGLEHKVQQRTRELDQQRQGMQSVLDNVQQGLVMVDCSGKMMGPASHALREWFVEVPEDRSLLTWLAEHSPKFSAMVEVGLEMVEDGIMPVEIAAAQLPRQLEAGEQTFEFAFQPVTQGAATEGEEDTVELLVVVTDITERLRAQAEGRRQADLLATFRHIMSDQVAFLEFLTEAESIIAVLTTRSYGDLAQFKRLVHTIKGNAAIFGMRGVASAADALESAVIDQEAMPAEAQIEELLEAWSVMRGDLEQLLGERESSGIAVDDGDYERVLRAMLDETVDRRMVAKMVESWRLEPAEERLSRLGQQVQRVAQRLSKGDLQVSVDDNQIRLDREHFASFWSNVVHVLRNAVDHGIESVTDREAAGKSAAGHVTLVTQVEGDELLFAVSDDGRGIDVERLRERALSAGIADAQAMSMEDLVFADGLSSRETASETSGRGVGMAAVREACVALGGRVEIHTRSGEGTRFEFRFPSSDAVYPGHDAAMDVAAA